MTYDEALSKLQSLAQKKGINYSLDRLDPILEALDNPHLGLKNSVHVAGTNGKGSTIAFIKAILIGLGFTVGTYTSPHKQSYCERMTIDKHPISESDFVRLFEQCYPFHKIGLTEFETLTIMSFLYFKEMKPDYILYETGLGGRLDATNVIIPRLSVITTIDYDHQAILGDTIEEIAKEKAGIMKSRVPVITTLTQKQEVLNILNLESQKARSPLIPVAPLDYLPEGTILNASCQTINASLAKAAVRQLEYNCNEAIVERGIQNAYLWGRFERKEAHDKTLIFDGAHNPSSIAVLVQTFKEQYPNKKPAIIFGIHQSKSAQAIIEGLSELSENLYYCEFDDQFAIPYQHIRESSSLTIKEFRLDDNLPDEEIILFSGSFYFLGALDF